MTDSITIKITKIKDKIEADGKKYALYDVEPFDYGDHNYSKVKIEYQEESDLSEFVENKSIKIEVGRDMIVGEGDNLLINGGTWNSDRTVWQKVKDTTKKTADEIGDASANVTKKTGEGLKKAGENLEKSAEEKEWPRWVLPVGIIAGVVLVIAIVIWIFKPKRK